jgi:regulator of sigma E protease
MEQILVRIFYHISTQGIDMNFLIQFFAFIVTILILISFHEAGHFLVAKLLGIKVLRFSIGFGKPILRFHDKKRTEYILALIPLGGYVKLLDEREVVVPESEKSLAFNRQLLWVRALVVLAGPLTNILFAIFGFWLMFIIGIESLRPIIGKVQPNSIAMKAGLQPADEILIVDGKKTPTLQKVVVAIVRRWGEKTTMTIQAINTRTQKKTWYYLDLSHWSVDQLKPNPLKSLGIEPLQSLLPPTKLSQDMLLMRKYPPFKALSVATAETWEFLAFNFLILKKMILGQVSLGSLGGPIAIFQTADQALKQGLSVFLGFLAIISIMLAFINILPIPGLDGGHLFNCLIEFIIRRPLSLKYELISIQVGMILLVAIIVLGTLNDILRLLNIGKGS